MNRVVRVMKEYDIRIPVVGIAKGPSRKKNQFVFGSREKETIALVHAHQMILIRVRDEAHRFAIAYQRKTRKIV